MRSTSIIAALSLVVCVSAASAQFDPNNGLWGKDDADYLRVMTWNVEDGICRTNDKVPGASPNNWDALVRIVAAMRPDVLILQETGDNSGNGTGAGVDSVSQLETVIDLFFNGGADPFNGGTVTSYVQLYAPGYTLPYVFVSASNDNFNRNVIVSKYPFGDVNGDTKSTYSDMIFTQPVSGWSVGGNGGIRGHQFVEIDLPDGTYLGDLVIGNSHLKAGGSSSDFDQRLRAAKNVSYFIHHWYNGDGSGTPDPDSKISDSPQATQILDANTPVIWGGDWNEEDSGATYGPRDWFAQGPTAGGGDGTDRDQTDSTSDSAVEFFNGSGDTQSSSKLDYICWHDSIATAQNQFVFNSGLAGANTPPELTGYIITPLFASSSASDHRPVIVDFQLPAAVGGSAPGVFDVIYPNTINTELEPLLQWTAAADADDYDVVVATDPGLTNVLYSQTGVVGTSDQLPGGLLVRCETYYWGVTANNANGSTDSTSYPMGFNTWLIGDVTTTGAGAGDPGFGVPDAQVTAADINFYVNAWVGGDLATADLTTTGAGVGDPGFGVPDGQITAADINYFVNAWVNGGCP